MGKTARAAARRRLGRPRASGVDPTLRRLVSGETMPLICLCYARGDQAIAAQVAGKLKAAAGVVLLSEAEVEDRLPDIERADGVAARVKAADLVAVIASDQPESLAHARHAIRAALFYDRRVAPARMDPTVRFEALARSPELRLGTAFADDPDGAAAKVFAVSDLRPLDAPDPDRDENGSASPAVGETDAITAGGGGSAASSSAPLGAPQLSTSALAHYVDQAVAEARRGAAAKPGAPIPFDDAQVDALGFPKSPASMLARWRLASRSGDVTAIDAFAADYADDPYFSHRALSHLAALRRRERGDRRYFAYRLAAGSVAAGALVWALNAACADGSCAPGHQDLSASGGRAAIAVSDDAGAALAAAERDRARLRRELDALTRERDRLAAQASEAGFAAGRVGPGQDPAAAIAERDRLLVDLAEAAESDRFNFEAELRELTAERDALVAASMRRERPAAAEARIAEVEAAAAAARDRLETRVAGLERERDRLSAALQDARAERDRFEQALQGGAAATAAARMRELEARLSAAERAAADLRAELAERDGQIAALSAEIAALNEAQKESAAIAVARVTLEEDAAGPRDTQGQRQGQGPLAGPGGPDAALVALLKLVRAELDAAHQRRVDAMRPGDVFSGPYLGRAEVSALQRCLRDTVGAPTKIDGLWGRRTTAAFLSVSADTLRPVSDCVSAALRRI